MKRIKAFFKWIWQQLKDWRNLVIFGVVCAVVGSEVWVPALIGLISGNTWWYGIAAVCWAFWLAPFTPFIPLCIAITFAVRKVIDKIKTRQKSKDKEEKRGQ